MKFALEVDVIELIFMSKNSIIEELMLKNSNAVEVVARFAEITTEVFPKVREPFAVNEDSEVHLVVSVRVESNIDLTVPSKVPYNWPKIVTNWLPE